jgi:c-di-GMP-binding flagellar brake protein YcgR
MGIINRVLSCFSHTKPVPVVKHEESHSKLFAQVNRYVSLIRLQDQRQLIEIISTDFIDSFQSIIIGVDLYHQQLIIDELSPRIQNPEALVGRKLTIRHQQNRQMINIDVDVVSWSEETHCLHLSLPEDIGYKPRRQDYRMELLAESPINALVAPLYGAPWHSTLTNISLGGMRIIVSGDLRPELDKHKPLKKCTFTLPSGSTITCSGHVKSFSFIGRPYRRTEISIEFDNLIDDHKFELQHFIEQISIAA